MKTDDLFKFNRSSQRLNEGMEKVFGKKLNLESFDLQRLEDARNKLRTQISQVRGQSGFNETIENEAITHAQWMLDAINAEIAQREEFAMEAEELEEKAPPTAKGERMVKHIKKGYADDGKLTDKEKGIAYATAWKQHNKEKNESSHQANTTMKHVKNPTAGEKKAAKDIKPGIAGYKDRVDMLKSAEKDDRLKKESTETGEDMTKVTEGEIQQASAIVTAKTMVDRVGRWIEELSGMENDTLLQLGDSIRDEMGQEQAKNFISAVAPAIQQALENLKTTRETLASGVRTLTGEEQAAGMLGAEPGAEGGEDMSAAAPDEMNMPAEEPAAPEAGDEFAAADAAAGGAEAAGREKRESIDFSNKLMKVLAG